MKLSSHLIEYGMFNRNSSVNDPQIVHLVQRKNLKIRLRLAPIYLEHC